jgi:hypothetical protein
MTIKAKSLEANIYNSLPDNIKNEIKNFIAFVVEE